MVWLSGISKSASRRGWQISQASSLSRVIDARPQQVIVGSWLRETSPHLIHQLKGGLVLPLHMRPVRGGGVAGENGSAGRTARLGFAGVKGTCEEALARFP